MVMIVVVVVVVAFYYINVSQELCVLKSKMCKLLILITPFLLIEIMF